MKKILIFGMNPNPGGVESFLMNYYRQFSKTQFQIDFLCNTKEKVAYEDELLETGSKIYHITPRSKNLIKYYIELNRFFKQHAVDYTIIWVNLNSLANIDYLKLAKKYEIPVRIVHSHNSQNMDSKLRAKLHYYNRDRIEQWATDFWACSLEAAKWFYNENTISKSCIIPNAIDVSKSMYSEEGREQIRKKYHLEDDFVIGNVGRLHFQKNQEFMLYILYELLRLRKNVKLILIGQGEDEEKLKLLAKELHIENFVLFAGIQSNISDWLSAFDLFLFPSKFEGLAIAALEAQANGLPMVTSLGNVSPDTKVNETVYFYSLDKSYEEWARLLFDLSQKDCRLNKDIIQKNFENSGYDIHSASQRLEEKLITMLE